MAPGLAGRDPSARPGPSDRGRGCALAARPLAHPAGRTGGRAPDGALAGPGPGFLLPPAHRLAGGGGDGHPRRRALGHRGPACAGRDRAPGVRSARSLQREPQVAPDRAPRPHPRPGAGLRPGLGPLLSGLRGRTPRPRAAGQRSQGRAPRRSLRGVLPRLRDPLQPEQRRELRGGPGSRHLGPLAHRAVGQRGPRDRERRTPHPGSRRWPPARSRLLVPHPGRPPPGRGGGGLRPLRTAPVGGPAPVARGRLGPRVPARPALERGERLGLVSVPDPRDGHSGRGWPDGLGSPAEGLGDGHGPLAGPRRL